MINSLCTKWLFYAEYRVRYTFCTKKTGFYLKKNKNCKKQVDRTGGRSYNIDSYITELDCYWEQAKPDLIC